MIIHEMEQNTEEWFAIKRGKPSGSGFSKIITSQGQRSSQLEDYASDLADEVYNFEVESYSNAYMARGHRLEEIARDNYEFKNGIIMQKVGFVEIDDLAVGVSPDGFINKNAVWECKSRKLKIMKKHIAYINKNKRVITDDFAQVQGNLWVTEREWCDYTITHPVGDFTFRQVRDEQFIKTLAKLCEEVCEKVNEETKGAFETMVNAQKGNVDYKSIPELQDVDCEPYRKPSSVHFKVTCKS